MVKAQSRGGQCQEFLSGCRVPNFEGQLKGRFWAVAGSEHGSQMRSVSRSGRSRKVERPMAQLNGVSNLASCGLENGDPIAIALTKGIGEPPTEGIEGKRMLR